MARPARRLLWPAFSSAPIALALIALGCGRYPLEWTPISQPDAETGMTAHADAAHDVAGPPSDAAVDRPGAAPDLGPPDAPGDRPSDPPTMMGTDARDLAEARVDLASDPRADVDAACPVDCSRLPNIRPGVVVECRAGQCVVPFGACRDGFAHCSFNPNDGCETDLSRPQSCGSCGRICSGFYSECYSFNGGYTCGPRCESPYPDLCGGFQCVDVKSDLYNCGACGITCFQPNTEVECQQGRCVTLGCSDPGWVDCTSDPGCETQLGTATDCGGCGDKACTLANTLFTCGNGGHCDAAICAPGYANCSATSPDCEAPLTSAPACMPAYGGTFPFATQLLDSEVTAIAPDGSFLLAGTFTGSVDFDPTTARDVRTAPNDPDGYITKINADGTYGWTRTLVGRGDNLAVTGVGVSATGAVLVTGWYNDTIDLDPGAAADVHLTTTSYQIDPFVVKLAADGSFVWGRTFVGSSGASGSATAIAVDASEGVYVAGYYQGQMDFDPGAGTDLHATTSSEPSGMLVKLTAAGTFGWARSFDNGDCAAVLSDVTVASDGSIWGTGSSTAGPGCPRTPGTPFRQDDVLIVKLGDGGDARGSWLIGSTGEDAGNAVTAGRDGSVYVGGAASALVDFDPGPGTATRWTGPYSGGFVLKLDATGGFLWARTLADSAVLALAGAPDGGVIAGAAAFSGLVTRLDADGVSLWTIGGDNGQTSAQSLAARGGSFAIVGTSFGGPWDFNPGPDIDPIYGDIVYLSRFRF